MLAVPQQEINLLDNNIPDNPEPVWDSDTTYSKGDKVQYNNYVYVSLIDDNKGNNPETSLDWYKDGPINRWACFDGFTDTKTKVENQDIYYKFKVSDVDYIAFFNLYAKSVNVKVTNNQTDEVVYDHTINLEYYSIQDWWEWTYTPPEYREDVAFNLPLFYDATLEVTITQCDNKAEVGFIVYGRSFNLGVTLYNAKVSRRTVVKKERNADGRIRTNVGIKYKRIIVPVTLYNNSIDAVLRKLNKINGIPTLFIGDEREDGFEGLLVYGIFKDFDIAIDPVISKYELEIEGVG